MTDADSSTLLSAKLQITTGYISGEDVLSFTNTTRIQGSFDASTGTLTLTKIAGQSPTDADFQAALRTVTYTDTSDTPNTTARTVTFTVQDPDGTANGGHDTSTATENINVSAVNDTPVAVTPTADYSATEQTVLHLQNTGLSVSDVDAQGGSETATLSVNEGTLNVSAGSSGAVVTNSGSSSVTIAGTLAQINALLAGTATTPGAVDFIDNNDNPSSSVTLTLGINDNGNTGGGGAKSASHSSTIDITPVNDAPAATAPTAHYSATEQTDLSLRNTGLSVSDVDGNSGVETATLSVGEGKLTIAVGDSGATIVSGNGSGSVVISGTIGQLNALLNTSTGTILYNDNTDTPGASTTLTLSINDSGNTGGGALTGSATATIDIAAVNDTPVAVTPTADYSATEQTVLHLQNTGLSVSDVDAQGGSETATLSVNEGTLNVSAGSSGAVVTNSGSSSVTIAGTLAQINALLAGTATTPGAVDFIDNNDNPSSSVTLTLAINDNGNTGGGGAKSASHSSTIDITPVNDAPAATAPTAHYSATEQTDLSLRNTGLSVSDVDGNSGVETATLSVGEGKLTIAVGDSGATIVSGNGSGSVVISGTIGQLNALLNTSTGTSSITTTPTRRAPALR